MPPKRKQQDGEDEVKQEAPRRRTSTAKYTQEASDDELSDERPPRRAAAAKRKQQDSDDESFDEVPRSRAVAAAGKRKKAPRALTVVSQEPSVVLQKVGSSRTICLNPSLTHECNMFLLKRCMRFETK